MGYLILAVVLAFVAHEGGHFAAALCFGARLQFSFAWGRLWKIPVPRGVWRMPDLEPWRQRVVALAGFGAEFAFVPVLYALAPGLAVGYALVVLAHFWAYPWYAGTASDFKWL